MARHNRTARGVDQRERTYVIDYPPDWLRRLRVTRALESGRQSTMNVFRNPSAHRREMPGATTRNSVRTTDGDVDFSITVHDPRLKVRQVTVTYELDEARPQPRGRKRRASKPDTIVYTFDGDLKPTPGR